MAGLIIGSMVAALLTVVSASTPAVAIPDRLVAGSWNMQGQHTGTGKEKQNRYRNAIQPRFNEGMEILALQEAGNEPPASALPSEYRPGDGVEEFRWSLGTDNSRPDPVLIYYASTGQQRNGLAFITRDVAQNAVQLAMHVEGDPADVYRPMMGVLLRGTWYFTAHARSGGGARNDAAEILRTARNFIRYQDPFRDWVVLADFNYEPDNMDAEWRDHIIRADQPTHEGHSELDWVYASASNQSEATVNLTGRNADHFMLEIVFSGCGLPRAGTAAAGAATAVQDTDLKCSNPIPGHKYRFYLTEKEKPDRLLTRLDHGSDNPWLTDEVRDSTEDDILVLFGRLAGTYKPRMGSSCLARTSNSVGALMEFGPCDPENQNSDWSFSNGKLLDPYLDKPMTAGPWQVATAPDVLQRVQMREESFAWRFEDTALPGNPGPGDPDNPGTPKRFIRLMPLGDSITKGVGSSDSNGYRNVLYTGLKGEVGGGQVDFVGSAHNGTMSDPQHEGHPSWRIDEIASVAACKVFEYQPNVITLHAGTNDFDQNFQLPSAPQRLKSLITRAMEDSPKAVVVVAKVIPTGKPDLQPRINAFNAALPGIVSDLRADGKHVVLVDTSDIKVSDGLEDESHPNDAGYAKLGNDFYRGVMEAVNKGWIQKPDPQKPPTPCQLPDDPADGTALGEGWRALGVIAPGMHQPANYGRTELAEMNGDNRADYVQIRKDGSIRVAINTKDQPGQPAWKPWGGGTGQFAPGGDSLPEDFDISGMWFADIDGNGRDDILHMMGSVKDNTLMYAYLNLPGDGGQPKWSPRLVYVPMKDVKSDHVRFADINGDGRDDVLRVSDTGQVHAYFNTWDPASPTPTFKEKLSWAPGASGATLENLRFADIDNDKKADHLMVGWDGSVHAYLNKGGKDAGGFEAHPNFANASNYPRKYIQFKDISGDGKADYLVVYNGGAVRAWLNRGGNL